MIEIKPLASGSSGNCYFVSDGKTSLLLDAGISIKEIEIGCNFRLSSVAGALITHRHNDHCKAVPALIKRGISVYASKDVFESKKVAGHRCKEISSVIDDKTAKLGRVYNIGSFYVYPFSVFHDVPNLGFYIHSTITNENLLYFTDTYYVKHVFPDLNFIIAEANYSLDASDESVHQGRIPFNLQKRLFKSHMRIDTLLEMLKSNDLSKCKRIYLCHLSDNNSREQDFKKQVQAATGVEVYIC